MAVERKDPHERAKRLARLIVGDIVLYNREKIVEGIKHDNLFQVMERELEEGRKYYEKNVDPAVAVQADYFNLAVVDILVKGRGDVQSEIW
jgi:hypothetical protein